MITIGDPQLRSKDGSTFKLCFLGGGLLIATVYQDRLMEFELNKRTSGVGLLKARLRGPRGEGLGRLHEADIIEAWSGETEGEYECIGVTLLEYIEGSTEEDGSFELVEIQGRSPCGSLIDVPASLQHVGTWRSLLEALAPGQLTLSAGIPDGPVSAYISAPSTYGALRLLASTRGLVLRDAGSNFDVLTRAELMDLIHSRPPATITASETLKARVTKGNRIKER